MSEKYIRQNKSSFNIVKNSKIYAKVTLLEDAIFIRDLLVEKNWNLEEIPKSIKKDDNYLVLAVVDEKIHVLAKYKTEPDEDQINKLTKRFIRNPNNSKYGLNITKVFDTFIIKKQIAGDEYIFGYYDNLCDAQFVRNFLLDNEWDVNKFKEIEFDEDTNSYKVICVIDDKVYVIDEKASKNQIDLEKSYERFLAKVSKHKYGLSNYPHLDMLKDKIPYLESEFQVKAKDDKWQLNNLDDDTSPLTEIIFTLTPFQQSVYDAISDDTSIEEIEKSLIRYKSKNFTQKILKNTDELIELDLIEKTGEDTFSKTNL
ncbi:hypothetical protein [Methanobrevibacter sp.]|uniref:hypothetical protein n=1 Tax=Methanobrevibacter sp. TaxID=66852 RepID=UPI0038908EAD